MRRAYLPHKLTDKDFRDQFNKYDRKLIKSLIDEEGAERVAREELKYWVSIGKAKRRKGGHELSRETMAEKLLTHFS